MHDWCEVELHLSTQKHGKTNSIRESTINPFDKQNP